MSTQQGKQATGAEAAPAARRPRLEGQAVANGVTAFLLAITGPFAILVAVGRGGGLDEAQIASWIFGSYALGGVLSLYFCWRYRQPLAMAWSIAGGLLLPAALDHLSFAEVIGAYWVTGLVITLLGWSGLVTRVIKRIPTPIVMGMVAGVFLPLGLKVVTAFEDSAALAGATLASYLLFASVPVLRRRVPPVLVAVAVAGVAAWLAGAISPVDGGSGLLVRPMLYDPEFTTRALVELVVPLTITVLGIHNTQGIAVVQTAGHSPPVKSITVGSGLGSLAFALVGSVPACLAGLSNGILVSSGERRNQWVGGMVFGIAMIAFGLMAPLATRFALALPLVLVGLIGGLAVAGVLQGAFQVAFRGECPLGALIAFVVSVAGVPILNIGAPFWALVFAFAGSWLLERDSLRRAVGAKQAVS